MNLEKPIRLADAAEFLGVSVKTVRRLVQNGKVRAFKIGGQLFLLPSEIQAYIHRQLAQSSGQPSC